jgi:hypothetical protein
MSERSTTSRTGLVVYLVLTFNLSLFDRMTVNTTITRWLTGEFGAVFAVTLVLTATLFLRVPSGASSPASRPTRDFVPTR